jgi:dTDP-4-amino-4,6-dideoxygalactose transaminase
MSKKLVYRGEKPIRENFLSFSAPLIGDEEIKEVVDTLKSGWLSTGPRTKQFEEEFKNYIGVNHVLALNSCTAGLSLALNVLGIKVGDEVITTPMTFAATANVIIHQGATPVFVDVDMDTQNIDTSKIEDAITSKTKAIIPVHLAGHPCEMDKIMDIAKRHNLYVIEDCAHAVEAEYKGKKIGTFGDMAAFSFYATKNLTTGEGGMLISNNEELIEKARIRSLHGMSKDAWKRFSSEGFKPYDIVYPGFKYNMFDLQSALGIHQLRAIERNLKRREEIYLRYNQAFSDLDFISIPHEVGDIKHSRHLYRILINLDKLSCTRNEFIDFLQKENIGVGVHYTALHLTEYYKNTFNFSKGMFSNTEFISDRTISLPLSPALSDQDVEDVINAVKKVGDYHKK